MSTVTPRYGLILPDLADFIPIPPVTGTPPVINTNFTTLDALVGCVICTSGTRPGSPTDGLPIYETDTKTFRVWSVTFAAWLAMRNDQYNRLVKSDLNSV